MFLETLFAEANRLNLKVQQQGRDEISGNVVLPGNMIEYERVVLSSTVSAILVSTELLFKLK